MINKLTLDFETYSECDITKAGSYKYSEHSSTEVLMVAFKLNDDPTDILDLYDENLERKEEKLNKLLYYINQIIEGKIKFAIAHNYAFEWAIWKNVCIKKLGWPQIPEDCWADTMHQCGMHALPLKLETSTEVLELTSQKNEIGKELIKLFSCPQKDGKRIYPNMRPEKYKLFLQYCIEDVDATYEMHTTLLWFKPEEEKFNIPLTHEMNANGIPVDVESAKLIYPKILIEKESYTQRISALTNGLITTVNQTQRMKKWMLSEFDIDMPNFQAKTVQDCLDSGEMPEKALKLLEMRANGGKSSTSKYERLLDMASDDGFIRNVFVYHGTTTGRLCIEEDSKVWVKDKLGNIQLKKIQNVLFSDMVHDGVEWVNHEGVVSNGEKETIEYEGIKATPNHKVLMDSGKTMETLEYMSNNEFRLALNKMLVVSAVYKITNTIDNKSYIGCSKRPNKRFKDHIKRANNGKLKEPLHKAIVQYGEGFFNFEILEWNLIEIAYKREAEIIKKIGLENLYNIDKGGTDGQLNIRHKVKREKDFKILYVIWKSEGIIGLLNYKYAKKSNGYKRLKILMDEHKFGTKEDLVNLIHDRKIQEVFNRSEAQRNRNWQKKHMILLMQVLEIDLL